MIWETWHLKLMGINELEEEIGLLEENEKMCRMSKTIIILQGRKIEGA